jgi:hypothetical protein
MYMDKEKHTFWVHFVTFARNAPALIVSNCTLRSTRSRAAGRLDGFVAAKVFGGSAEAIFRTAHVEGTFVCRGPLYKVSSFQWIQLEMEWKLPSCPNLGCNPTCYHSWIYNSLRKSQVPFHRLLCSNSSQVHMACRRYRCSPDQDRDSTIAQVEV